MESRFGSCKFLFHLLLIVQCCCASSSSRSRKTLEEFKHHSSTKMDPSVNIFFTVDDLRQGKQMAIYFSIKDSSSSPHLLPRKEADSIPFSSSKLSYLLKLFSFPQGSLQAKAIKYTIKQCELPPIKGETRLCATSLESMLDFGHKILTNTTSSPENNKIKILSTSFLTNHTVPLQNYTFMRKPQEILASKIVACHSMPYPYAVYFCHSQKDDKKLVKISLEGENGERAEAAAVCHMDTSHWNDNHPAFRVLRIRPGVSSVCHFFPVDNLVMYV